jgi:triosephosphate isomerase
MATSFNDEVNDANNVDLTICTHIAELPAVQQALAGSNIAVGAQNVHWAASGAFTGGVSASMLKGLASYAIVGHSERRQYFGETDQTVNQRAKAALAAGITPIVCVGESLEQNERGETQAFVSGQVKAALADFTAEQVPQLVIAYEPIWAIGTGRSATSQQANDICGGVVRATVAELYGPAVAENTRILYGGSTNEKNIRELMEQPDIDGALIGGAALKVESYGEMVRVTGAVYA